MRIVALIPGGIEEQILCLPTLETLKQNYPKGAIDVIVEPRAKPAYSLPSPVHEVLPFDYQDSTGLADYLNLLGTIRDREYDAALLTQPLWALELLLWLNGIPLRIGYQGKASWFLSQSVPLKLQQYAPHRYHDLLRGLEINAPCPPLRLKPLQEDREWARGEQQRVDIQQSNYLLIHGGESYPVAKFAEIIAGIQQKKPDLPIILLNDGQPLEWLKEMQAISSELKLISPPDVGKLAAIVAGANTLVCTSGLPLILATGLETNTVALLEASESLKLIPPDQKTYQSVQAAQVADISPQAVISIIWGPK